MEEKAPGAPTSSTPAEPTEPVYLVPRGQLTELERLQLSAGYLLRCSELLARRGDDWENGWLVPLGPEAWRELRTAGIEIAKVDTREHAVEVLRMGARVLARKANRAANMDWGTFPTDRGLDADLADLRRRLAVRANVRSSGS